MSDAKEPTSPKQQEAKLLDLTRFESLEHAVTLADEVGRNFTKLGRLGLQDSNLTDLKLFYMSALARAQSLHDAIVREIRHSNQHAVFTLMRSYAETAAIILLCEGSSSVYFRHSDFAGRASKG
jgi:hypothetical protein